MASSSSIASFSSLNLHFSVQTSSTKFHTPSLKNPRRRSLTTVAAISETPSISSAPATTPSIREIPGDYGLPYIGAWKDRQDYFYNQGVVEFFKSRVQKYNSTVFRANMPPGPFIASNPNVIILLDGKSFPILFDVDKVEKKDLFTGTYMPSTNLTGGYRILSYLDPSEPNHAKLKNLLFFLLTHRRQHFIPEFQNSYGDLFKSLEKEISDKGKGDFGSGNDPAAFKFLTKAFYGVDPKDTKLGSSGPTIILLWVFFQLHPILSIGLPSLIENFFIHTFPLPPFLIKSSYDKLFSFFLENSSEILDHAENTLGLSRDEACHNLLFATCFNTFGGMKIFFPSMVKWVGSGGADLHAKLAKEIRSAIESNDGKVTMAAMEAMPLMKSTVYESLRIEPPVPLQYAKAKKDFTIESHDSVFEIKKGEMLFGYQPFATKDPKIFDRPEEFVPDRFVGEGEKLLENVLWSNGPETEKPSVDNKQCAGKEFVVLASRLLLVEIFRRYDSFEVEAAGKSMNFTSLKPASF